MQLTLQSYSPARTKLVLVDDANTSTGYRPTDKIDWGNVVWEHAFSGPRGTQGARASQGTPQNRPVLIPLKVSGSTKDQLAQRISKLHVVIDEMRRFGGRITWRANGQTYRQNFEVMASTGRLTEWSNRAETMNQVEYILEFVCAPYIQGDPMGFSSAFTADNYPGDFAAHASTTNALTDYAIEDGRLKLATAGLPRAQIIRYVGGGYSYTDPEMSVRLAPTGTVWPFTVEMRLRVINDNNMIKCFFRNDTMFVQAIIGGTATTIGTVNAVGMWGAASLSTHVTLRARVVGNTIRLDMFRATEPAPQATGDQTLTVRLTETQADTLGAGVAGQLWFATVPTNSAGGEFYLDNFKVVPYVQTSRAPGAAVLRGIPGDAPALCDFTWNFANGDAGGDPLRWAMLGWGRQNGNHNLVHNGNFEYGTNGWDPNVGLGLLNGGGTVTTTTTDPRFGRVAGVITTTAAFAFMGAGYRIYTPMRAGVTYTAEAWVKLPAGTAAGAVQLVMGGGSSSAGSSSVATTAWQKLTTSVTPTADVTDWGVAIRTTTATALTINVDGVRCWEGKAADAPTAVTQKDGAGAWPAIGMVPAESATDISGFSITTGVSTYTDSAALLMNAPAGEATAYANWFIDPSLVTPDDYTQGELLMEVWASYVCPSTAVGARAVISAFTEDGTNHGPQRYSNEFGSTGKALVATSPNTQVRVSRLGTLSLAVETTRRYKLQVLIKVAAGATAGVHLDHLVLVPARSRALSPTGKPMDSTYPIFINGVGHTSKTIRSDLSGQIAKPPYPPTTSHGLGGSLLELPPGNATVVTHAATVPPDEPTGAGAGASYPTNMTPVLYYNVTPRFHLLRDA